MATRRLWKTDTLTVWVECDDEGVVFNGVDTGGWSSTSEYEYWVSVKAPDLRRALGVGADVDLGELLADRAADIIGPGETAWLTALGVEYTVQTWYSFDDD